MRVEYGIDAAARKRGERVPVAWDSALRSAWPEVGSPTGFYTIISLAAHHSAHSPATTVPAQARKRFPFPVVSPR